jgi:hypothetical protein
LAPRDVQPGTEVILESNAQFEASLSQADEAVAASATDVAARAAASLQATADSQRFMIEAAYLTRTSNVVLAAIQEASLQAQIAASESVITANSKMLDMKPRWRRFNAILLPLRRSLAIQRDMLSALAGRFPTQEPNQTLCRPTCSASRRSSSRSVLTCAPLEREARQPARAMRTS